MRRTRLTVSGMTCGHCASAVEKALTNQKGVRTATVHLDSGEAEVEYEESPVAPEQLLAGVRDSGYESQIVGGG